MQSFAISKNNIKRWEHNTKTGTMIVKASVSRCFTKGELKGGGGKWMERSQKALCRKFLPLVTHTHTQMLTCRIRKYTMHWICVDAGASPFASIAALEENLRILSVANIFRQQQIIKNQCQMMSRTKIKIKLNRYDRMGSKFCPRPSVMESMEPMCLHWSVLSSVSFIAEPSLPFIKYRFVPEPACQVI